MDPTLNWINAKFGKNPELAKANEVALKTGYNFADTTEVFTTHFTVKKAVIAPGRYRKITGNEATAIGFVTAAQLAGRPLFYGSYPITPASDILHELARHKNFGVKTFQAEDEIAAKFTTDPTNFMPYARDEVTLARPWALPGTPGLEHRIGGIEKQHISGNVNYDPENHHLMVKLRQEKVDRAMADVPPVEVFGEASGKVLVLGWGSTYGSITSAVERMRDED